MCEMAEMYKSPQKHELDKPIKVIYKALKHHTHKEEPHIITKGVACKVCVYMYMQTLKSLAIHRGNH